MNKKITLTLLIRKNKVFCVFISMLFLSTYFLNIAEVMVLDYFINSFQQMNTYKILIVFTMLSAIYGIYYIHGPLTEYMKSLLNLKFSKPLKEVFIYKLSKISMGVLEKQENQALINRLQESAQDRFVSAFFGALSILGSVISLVGIFYMLLSAGIIFIIIILFMIILMVIMFIAVGEKRAQLSRARAEITRRSDYLSEILFEKRLVQEKKLFHYTDFIHGIYEEEVIQSDKRMFKSIFITNGVIWIYDNITYIFAASSYLLLLVPLFEKRITIGLYVALVPALIRIGSFFVAIVRDYHPALKEYALCMKDFTMFHQLEEQYYNVKEPSCNEIASFHHLQLKNVAFSYDKESTPVLQNLNLDIEYGKSYALVGANGCGKTTLIKLLLGLYRPDEGEIKIDGADISTMPFSQLQKYYSVIFQDFNHYDYSIKDNIVISDLKRKEEKDKMADAARGVGIEQYISKLPAGYHTLLGNLWEDGTELSLGQWQKLAISRLLFRNAPIYVWDEPTAAMDPISESKLYSYYLEQMSKKCTNIFITHRLGAAVMADVICVLDGGNIVEMGSHTELMKITDGIYKTMFEMQKGLYI